MRARAMRITPAARATLAAALASALALAGCGSDRQALQSLDFAKAAVATANSMRKPAPLVTLSRARIRAVGRPVLRIDLPTRRARAYLVMVATTGPVVTWSTTDGTTVSLRDGLLIQTRGLGVDLMSAAVPAVADLARGSGTVRATYYHLDGDDQTIAQDVTCTLADRGREEVTITEIRYPLHHVAALCSGAGASFTNDYWFDSRRKIRQSRQWVGEEVGYADIADLQRVTVFGRGTKWFFPRQVRGGRHLVMSAIIAWELE